MSEPNIAEQMKQVAADLATKASQPPKRRPRREKAPAVAKAQPTSSGRPARFRTSHKPVVLTIPPSEIPTYGHHLCGRCPAKWGGHSTCHCSSCHRTFGSIAGFDKHRNDGECMDPATLKKTSSSLVLSEKGIWVQYRDPAALDALLASQES